ncbi:YceI family protein [Rufibacter tibetensis]|uniref:Lipid/polyisoprenoid-binding YceI-like domain-containing protein n=1 Tax=Rufibacter tibetensis TaxID=512763 RepID=A0A0P0D0X6_9BACT|nr:YceI family protein [Rufibacter tibetensis]ALJ00458.1 hypothetical protein DC20_17640 [Rufibacter tibetensis]
MKNSKLILLFVILTLSTSGYVKAQFKSETRTAKVSFRSQTPIEEFYSENNQVASILKVDGKKKVLAFNVIMRSFKFDKALMEEHFNEKYVHSEKYPTAKFVGEFAEDIDLTTPGKYKNISISGTMTLHGVSRTVTVPVDLEVGKNNEIKGHATFKIKPEEFNIEIPKLVSEKISREIVVTVDALYKPAR